MKDVLLEALSPADIGDDTYNVGRYQNPDGRLHLIFTTEAQKREIDTRKFSFTRLTYRQFGDSVLFLGLRLPLELRGRKAGSTIFRYFRDMVGEDGNDFIGTGLIHKPLVALMLQNEGLVPESNECVVEILPQSGFDPSAVPDVQYLNRPTDTSCLILGSESGNFYNAIDPEIVLQKYPLVIPPVTVAIHTRYTPT